eukprot:scaffold221462_cov21-Tisochrysis_lutea.AAC.1
MQGVARPCMRGMVPILWQTQQRAEPLMVCMLETGASASLQGSVDPDKEKDGQRNVTWLVLRGQLSGDQNTLSSKPVQSRE